MAGTIRVAVQSLQTAIRNVAPGLEDRLMDEIMVQAGYRSPPPPEDPPTGPITSYSHRKRREVRPAREGADAPASEPALAGAGAAPAERSDATGPDSGPD